RLDIVAATEGRISPGQDHTAHLGITLRAAERGFELGIGLAIERVAYLGAIQRDRGDVRLERILYQGGFFHAVLQPAQLPCRPARRANSSISSSECWKLRAQKSNGTLTRVTPICRSRGRRSISASIELAPAPEATPMASGLRPAAAARRRICSMSAARSSRV